MDMFTKITCARQNFSLIPKKMGFAADKPKTTFHSADLIVCQQLNSGENFEAA